ncbi:hypothetical protein EMIT053CA3_200085 [Pseudomonas donghuensis]
MLVKNEKTLLSTLRNSDLKY